MMYHSGWTEVKNQCTNSRILSAFLIIGTFLNLASLVFCLICCFLAFGLFIGVLSPVQVLVGSEVGDVGESGVV